MRDLHVEIAGEGAPVVLIHAGNCDSGMWDPQWATWRAAHRIVRYDMRGFGRSPLPPGRFSHARDLVELFDELALERASLVGVSLGGRVALEIAVARPDLVDALVLVGPGLRGHEWSHEVERFAADEAAALERGDLDAAAELNVRVWVDGRRPAGTADAAVRERVREMTKRSFAVQQRVGEAAEEEPLVPDLADRLGEIRVPTLVLVGEHDIADIHEIADRLVTAIPAARNAVIPGAGHVPTLEQPEAFDEVVVPFLAAAEEELSRGAYGSRS